MPAIARTRRERPGAALSRVQAVERAEAYARAHLGAPVSVTTLSRVAGLSERGLRNAFYGVRGMSPKRCILTERLLGARRALSGAAGDTTTVTGVATRYGFYELGRFAATYRDAFGEAPSATLRDGRKSAETMETTRGPADVCTR